jgi:hypothetical protein
MKASVPGFGGTTSTGPFAPSTADSIVKRPPEVRLNLTAVTGPCSPRGSS